MVSYWFTLNPQIWRAFSRAPRAASASGQPSKDKNCMSGADFELTLLLPKIPSPNPFDCHVDKRGAREPRIHDQRPTTWTEVWLKNRCNWAIESSGHIRRHPLTL